jgi:hypothetical protein
MNYMAGMPILFWRQKSMAWPTVSGPTARKATAPRGRRRIPLCDEPVIKGPSYYRRLNPSDRELK